MVVRLVKLRFRESEIPNFLKHFEVIKDSIRASEGCLHLQLLQDTEDPCIFFTHSHWNSNDDLQAYRNSDLFKEIWTETKAKFDGKPEAWSTDALFTLS